MIDIILATNNENKVREIKSMLEDTDINVISLKTAGIDVDVEETGTTFEENALIKAREVCKMANVPVLADDSGLEIDFLNGEPGVYSARFMGKDTPYSEKNLALIKKLEGVEGDNRAGGFKCCMAFVLPDGREFVTEGTMRGIIAYEPSGTNGFGYDPIVYLPEYGMTSAQLTPEEKNRISHRGEAVRKMVEIIKREILV